MLSAQQNSDFRIEIPFDAFLDKSEEDKKQRRIRGFVTTEHPDREGEIVLQRGLDFSEFLAHGYFNDNHNQSTGAALGWPVSVTSRPTPDGKKGHFVEGYLVRGYKPADDIWKLALALQNTPGCNRRLGFSVEGKILDRGKQGGTPTVAKAKVRNVAITNQPVNPYTGMEALTKALTAGSAIESPGAVSGSGFALRTESLEGQSYRLTEEEAIRYLMNKGYSRNVSDRILSLALAA